MKSSFQRLRLFLCYCSTIVAPKKALFHVISFLGDLVITYISTDIARSLSCFVKEITTTIRCVRIFLSRSGTVAFQALVKITMYVES